ncbi:hypothetical protein E2562_035758 [Oryza meyeriana var. granulata]|uniref:Uncharacterized protein n=2 Tax=Oryza meyeriana var. granulata TaxID=110450 RepID=A0A6G1FFV0_9ORYZ|nr:hypothetical protein E2562_035758 [Oryza meyeriana var. granulata]KAF0935724.1 hypothetical protein E2562_035758 [Oryza meyeriana var. granulata]KAF0935751.1 hypothetical protein E2562_035758 [Oryza meyeriana var. granulata]
MGPPRFAIPIPLRSRRCTAQSLLHKSTNLRGGGWAMIMQESSVSAGDLGRSTEQHLYLALDDWNGGYRIHRLDADDILDQELAPAAAGGGEHKLPDICCCPVASRSAATTRPPECRMLREKLIRRKEEGPKHFFLSKGKSISLTYMGDGRFALVENILPSEDFNDGAVLHVTLFGLRFHMHPSRWHGGTPGRSSKVPVAMVFPSRGRFGIEGHNWVLRQNNPPVHGMTTPERSYTISSISAPSVF